MSISYFEMIHWAAISAPLCSFER